MAASATVTESGAEAEVVSASDLFIGDAGATTRRRSPVREVSAPRARRRPPPPRRSSDEGFCKQGCSPLCFTLCLLLCGSVALLSIGAWFLAVAGSLVREKLLEKYSASIADWRQTRPDFASISVSLQASDGASVALLAEDMPDQFFDYEESQGFEELPTYSPLVYRIARLPRNLVLVSDVQLDDESNDYSGRGVVNEFLPVARQFELVLSPSGLSGKDTVHVTTGLYPLFKLYRKPSNTLYPTEHTCRPDGTLLHSSCWMIMTLSKLCIQVKREERGGWAPALHNESDPFSFGCNVLSNEWVVPSYAVLPDGGDPAAEILQLVQAANVTGAVDLGKVLSSTLANAVADNMIVEVRSSADPYLKALRLTDGSLDFGMSAADETEWGHALLALGGLLCLPLCGFVALRRCLERLERRWEYEAERNEERENFRATGFGRYADFEEED
eukprot:TRINITY_DN100499_c0_g1_i1.p1 TRINITY_DN100499_c0_g1~~TRINITY_DN100499_c0_g1_i1.p1  ORF type:complete len:445 (+),score=40.99 TRINITY_DN100499_c0_g1_i1:112-1446(+)